MATDEHDDDTQDCKKLRALLEAGETSGISDRTPQEIWREAEERYLATRRGR